MTAGQRPALGLIVAGAFSLLVPALVALSSGACTALWTQPGTWAGLATMSAAGLSLVWAGMDGRDGARILAQLPAGIVVGLQIQPSTGALVALLVAGLALRAAPRSWFAEAISVFAAAAGLGFLVLMRAFSGGASC
ncbi:MAG TPA: hypothetical protein VFW12_05160 [Candidatus Limnocylindria bacterium]|nr:hypothetical protein [Candidatus Limnocylindria bacterium]